MAQNDLQQNDDNIRIQDKLEYLNDIAGFDQLEEEDQYQSQLAQK